MMKNYYLDRAAEKEEKEKPTNNITYIIGVDSGVDYDNVNWTYTKDIDWKWSDWTISANPNSCQTYTYAITTN
jgi:hypothetical protein